MGKDVYGRDGQKIGSIDDVVLSGSGTQQLAVALAASTSSQSGSMAGSTGESSAGSVTGSTGATPSPTGTSAASGSTTGTSGSSGNLSGSTSSQDTSSIHSDATGSTGAGGEAAVLVSTGGLFSRNDSKVRIPISQLRWDSSSNHLTCDISKSDVDSKTGNSSSSR